MSHLNRCPANMPDFLEIDRYGDIGKKISWQDLYPLNYNGGHQIPLRNRVEGCMVIDSLTFQPRFPSDIRQMFLQCLCDTGPDIDSFSKSHGVLMGIKKASVNYFANISQCPSWLFVWVELTLYIVRDFFNHIFIKCREIRHSCDCSFDSTSSFGTLGKLCFVDAFMSEWEY